jgi:hypothetical protein
MRHLFHQRRAISLLAVRRIQITVSSHQAEAGTSPPDIHRQHLPANERVTL